MTVLQPHVVSPRAPASPRPHPQKSGEGLGARLGQVTEGKGQWWPSCTARPSKGWAGRPQTVRSHTYAGVPGNSEQTRQARAGRREPLAGAGCGAAAKHVSGRGLQRGGRDSSFCWRLKFRTLKQYQRHRGLKGCQVPSASLVFFLMRVWSLPLSGTCLSSPSRNGAKTRRV